MAEFLKGKSDEALRLFDQLMACLTAMGPVKLHATRSMIVISADVKFAYVIAIGRQFVDVVLPFDEHYADNTCFRKSGKVPGSRQYNHHLRIMHPDDLNEEVCFYLRKAYANGKTI